MPQASTKARGGAEPIRAMTRSQRTFSSPSRVSKMIHPLSIVPTVVWRSTVSRPRASAAVPAAAAPHHRPPAPRLGGERRLDVGALGRRELGRAVDEADAVALLRIGGEAE